MAADLDLDGWMDLYVANDGVANQMWINQGDGTFSNEAVFSGSALNQQGHPEAGMGVDAGDVDNDGDDDFVLTNNNGAARLLINRAADGTSWLGMRLLTEGRDALGAQVTLRLANGARMVRRVRTDGSYCSARDPRIRFGLASGSVDGLAVRAIEVAWPDGRRELWPALALDRYHVLIQGEGQEIRTSGTSALASASVASESP